jgi:hypothetical protein
MALPSIINVLLHHPMPAYKNGFLYQHYTCSTGLHSYVTRPIPKSLSKQSRDIIFNYLK